MNAIKLTNENPLTYDFDGVSVAAQVFAACSHGGIHNCDYVRHPTTGEKRPVRGGGEVFNETCVDLEALP